MPIKRTAKRKDAVSHELLRRDTTAEVGVILMDLSFRIIAIDSGAASILAALCDSSHYKEDPDSGVDLPPEMLEWMRRSERIDSSLTTMRFYAGRRLYKGRRYRIEFQDRMLPRSALVLYLERETELDDAIMQVSLNYRLTEREQEALRGLASGLTSKELAERMSIRPSTVKTFLRLIMIKMGASNRARVVAKILAASRQLEEESTAGATETGPGA